MAYLDIAASGETESKKLHKIIDALMCQVERSMDGQGNSYSLFQTATVLEDKVKVRTIELESALNTLESTNRELSRANSEAETARIRLLEAVESISDGFVLFDRDDKLALSNTRFLDFWGQSQEGMPIGITFNEHIKKVVRSGLIADTDDDPQAWVEARLERHSNPKAPFVLKLSDGRWLRVDERHTNDGGTVGIYTDISDIKHQEEQRRQQELAEKSVLLQSSLDNLTQGVSVFDKDLKLVAWNERFIELLQLPEGMVQLGTHYEEYMAYNIRRGEYGGGDFEAFKTRMKRAKEFAPLAIEYTRPGGSSLEIRRNPMPSGGFVTTYTDVTESRKAAEDLRESKVNLERRVKGRTAELMALNDQLRKEIDERTIVEEQLKLAKTEAEEANISKTKFLAAASHDLLQPLNAARLFTSALTDRKPSGKDGELAEGINGALRGVESMLNALLDISKLDAGAVPIETTDFPLSSLLSRIVSEHTPIAAEAGLTFRTVPCKAIVRTDRKLLGRIVRNLISNAIRYTPKGKILVGCRKRKDAIRLEVWDTGIGISEDLREEIFEEFRQLGGETRDGDKGVGLGLAIVKRIAQIQNHLVGVQSIPGKGSVFYIDLPKGEMEANTTEASRSLGSVENKIPGTRVLVIDNEQTILDGMDSLLKGWECTVETGLSITDVDASMVSPDLIIIDYHLDDAQNGIDGIAALRKKLGSAILGIVITADRTEGIKAAVEKAGLYIMNKPVRPAKLRALIGHIRSE